MTEPEPHDPYAPPADGALPTGPARTTSGPPPRLDPWGRPVEVRPEPGGHRAVILGGISLPLALVAPPVGLVCGFFAIRTGNRSHRRARESGAIAPFATTGIVLGAVGLAASVLVLIVAAVFFREISDFMECQRGAGTETAKERCQQEFLDELERRTGTRP